MNIARLGLLPLGLAVFAVAGCGAATPVPGALPSPIALPRGTSTLPAVRSAFPSPPAMPTGPATVVTSAPTPTFAPFPFEVGPDEPARGPAAAPVTIIQYGDFQGPYDALLEPALRRILADHPTEVRLVWRSCPLINVNDKAYYAAVAAEAARRQGKFWEMHDLLFDHYREWAALPPDKFWSLLDDFADELNLDLKRLGEDLTAGDVLRVVIDDYNAARKVGVLGTPVLVINHTPYTGPLEHSVLETTVRLELLKPRQYRTYPDLAIDVHKGYAARLHTAKGDITFTLFARQAPVAVNSFVFLAREGWYDGNSFFRVVPGDAVYTGDPSDTGLGSPGYLFADEIDPGLRFDAPGVVALNNAGPNTNGSQFFITFAARPQFDGSYTIIGRVTSGLDVLSRLSPRNPAANPDAPPGDRIETVTIIEQ